MSKIPKDGLWSCEIPLLDFLGKWYYTVINTLKCSDRDKALPSVFQRAAGWCEAADETALLALEQPAEHGFAATRLGRPLHRYPEQHSPEVRLMP